MRNFALGHFKEQEEDDTHRKKNDDARSRRIGAQHRGKTAGAVLIIASSRSAKQCHASGRILNAD